MLEVLACARDARRPPRLSQRHGRAIAQIRKLHDRMMGFYNGRKRLEYYKLNQAIHRHLREVVRQRLPGFDASSIQSRLKRIRFIGNEAPESWGGAVQEHVEIVEALERRDGDRLAEVIARHLDETWTGVRPDSLVILLMRRGQLKCVPDAR